MEDKKARLKRFRNGPPVEIIETLLNSIDNFFNNEIDVAAEANLWHLVILGDHAVALIIADGLFGKSGPDGFKLFLQYFVDTNKKGFNFSQIYRDIHAWRNAIAHQWLSFSGYRFGLDFKIPAGWEKRNGVTFFNPILYHKSFKSAFSAGGKIWDYDKILNDKELEEAKIRLLNKYLNR